MTGGRRLGALALLGALAPQAGCSFLFVDKPTVSAGYAQGSNCTTSPAAPIIDAALTLWQGARAVNAASSSDTEYQGGGLSRGAVMSSGMLLFMLFGASMVSGFTHTSTCREAQEIAKEPLRLEPEPRIDPLPRPAMTPPPAQAAPSVQPIPEAPAADGDQPPAADGAQPPPPPPGDVPPLPPGR